MCEVLVSADVRAQIELLPLTIQARIQRVIERLQSWPQISGVKPLRGQMHGTFRIRTGDYRLLFRVNRPTRTIVVFRVADRRDVYE